jgi:hypothetical protein
MYTEGKKMFLSKFDSKKKTIYPTKQPWFDVIALDNWFAHAWREKEPKSFKIAPHS